MKHLKHLVPPGYYRLQSGKIVRLACRDTGVIYVRDVLGKASQIERATMALAAPLKDYRPAPAELWTQSEAIQVEKVDPKHKEFIAYVQKIELFLTRLIEFHYIRLNLRGYYGGSARRRDFLGVPAGEVIGERIVSGLAFNLASYVSEQNPRGKELVEQWALNPCQQTLTNIAPKGVRFAPSMDCHVTGLHFRWHYDGAELKPVSIFDRAKREYADVERFHGVKGHLPAASYTIDIPSGEIAFFQWINDDALVKDLDASERGSVNSEAGRINYSRYFEGLNFWHLYVGGRGRALYQRGKTLRIGRKPEDRVTKHEKEIWRGWKELGRVSFRTDLRWFTACDASRLKPKHFKEDEILVIKVPPGRYTLTDHVEHYIEETIFATIKKTA